MGPKPIPSWKLPPGVSRGCWDYAHSAEIAQEYDQSFADDALFGYDQRLLAEHFTQPGRLIDLGCGTGRHVIAFAQHGFEVTGVDLSEEMLNLTQRKADAAGLSIQTHQANLVELTSTIQETFDYAVCMFSTLGMIQGHEHRLHALTETNRVLKPGGQLAIHVHNLWSVLKTFSGRNWFIRHTLQTLLGNEIWGDTFAAYRGISQFYLHFFTAGELRKMLEQTGFRILIWHPLQVRADRQISPVSICSNLRADGWILIAEKVNKV